jgi:hypothetical protein
VRRPNDASVAVSVQLYQGTQTSPTFTRTVSSNATTGVFTFNGIAPGDYNLTAVDPVNNQRFTLPVTVAAGQTATRDITLNAIGTIQVTVTLEDGASTPLASSRVESCLLTSPTSTSCFPSSRGTTSATGQFTIVNQIVGRHYVRVSHPLLAANQKTTIVEIPDSVTPGTAVFSLPVTANLRVTVRRADGTQVSGADINAFYGPNNAASGNTSSATVPVSVPVFGNYRLSALMSPDYLIESDTKTGTVTQNAVDVPVTLTFPETATLTGRVLDVNGQPVPGGYVEITLGANYNDWLDADATGAFCSARTGMRPPIRSPWASTSSPCLRASRPTRTTSCSTTSRCRSRWPMATTVRSRS